MLRSSCFLHLFPSFQVCILHLFFVVDVIVFLITIVVVRVDQMILITPSSKAAVFTCVLLGKVSLSLYFRRLLPFESILHLAKLHQKVLTAAAVCRPEARSENPRTEHVLLLQVRSSSYGRRDLLPCVAYIIIVLRGDQGRRGGVHVHRVLLLLFHSALLINMIPVTVLLLEFQLLERLKQLRGEAQRLVFAVQVGVTAPGTVGAGTDMERKTFVTVTNLQVLHYKFSQHHKLSLY